MILSSTSPYALLKEFSIACGFKYDAVFRVCLNNFCERLLGCIANDVRRNLSRLKIDLDDVKSLLKWCSISNIIGANYIWRHRVKKKKKKAIN